MLRHSSVAIIELRLQKIAVFFIKMYEQYITQSADKENEGFSSQGFLQQVLLLIPYKLEIKRKLSHKWSEKLT